MTTIALITLIDKPTSSELKTPHRLIGGGTATVSEIPRVGEKFSVHEMPSVVLECLRVDISKDQILPIHSFHGHEATVFVKLHSHRSLPA
ncbi:MAG: hypothetical protein EON58_12945 [Alphaproteobacteria bacterium]|nr:MAG: hypothetical protein EON58_12945 [Alphaproteobacteria bacterium]